MLNIIILLVFTQVKSTEKFYYFMSIDSTVDAIYDACRLHVEDDLVLYDNERDQGLLNMLTYEIFRNQLRRLRKKYSIDEAAAYVIAYLNGWDAVRTNFGNILSDSLKEEYLMRENEIKAEIMEVGNHIKKYKSPAYSYKNDFWEYFEARKKNEPYWYQNELKAAKSLITTDIEIEEEEKQEQAQKQLRADSILALAKKVNSLPALPKSLNWITGNSLDWSEKKGDYWINITIRRVDDYDDYVQKGWILLCKHTYSSGPAGRLDDDTYEWYFVRPKYWEKVLQQYEQ